MGGSESVSESESKSESESESESESSQAIGARESESDRVYRWVGVRVMAVGRVGQSISARTLWPMKPPAPCRGSHTGSLHGQPLIERSSGTLGTEVKGQPSGIVTQILQYNVQAITRKPE